MENGSELSFLLGLLQVGVAISCELLNIYMLKYQHNIQNCIVYFISFLVIMEVSNMYFESLMNNKLKSVVHHRPDLINKTEDNVFSNRTRFHKFARLVYKFIRLLQVSFIFYFIPFSIFIIQYEKTYEYEYT